MVPPWASCRAKSWTSLPIGREPEIIGLGIFATALAIYPLSAHLGLVGLAFGLILIGFLAGPKHKSLCPVILTPPSLTRPDNPRSTTMPGPIRPASIDDLPAVERIVHDAYVKYVERIGKPPGPMLDDYRKHIQAHEVWAILDNNDVVGVLVLVPKPDHLLLDNVAVDPRFHGKGIGRVLIVFAEREAERRGYDEIRLYTHQKMAENIAMYPRLGYEETGRAEHDGFERVFFRKCITSTTP